MTDGQPCSYPGCAGVLDAGYCDVCGRAPLQAHASVGAAAVPSGAPEPGPAVGRVVAGAISRVGTGNGHGTDLAPPPIAAPVPGPAFAPEEAAALSAAPDGGGREPSVSMGPPPGGPDDWEPDGPAGVPSGDGSPCAWPGCDGRLDAGYCDTCGRAPASAPLAPSGRTRMPSLRPSSVRTDTGRGTGRGSSSTSGGTQGTGSSRTRRRTDSARTGTRRTGARLGLGLVDVPAMAPADPTSALMPVAEVPEGKRFCSNCNQPVGRSRNLRPGRTEGFCPHCRARYSFIPRLKPGDRVGGQYDVLGVLAHGGLGWIYLAQDRAVSDRWVVLKGLLDASSEDAANAAVAERQFLAALDHPNVVRIYNFVTHEGAGYIVMEYVGGKSLKELLKERRDANGGRMNPLPVEQAIAYALGTLPAMGYFHSQGLVYCDMKPDNVLLSGDGLKIIDLGGVRRIDDDEAAIYGTAGYQAPEVADMGPSPQSDLYTIGRMLAVLVLDFRGYQGTYVHSLPPPDEHPLLAEHESFHRFLLKSTAPDPDDRFESAEEMSEQLLGILREEAASHGVAHPAVSTVFDADGVVVVGDSDRVEPDWQLLPEPKVDPSDPGVGVVLGLADGDPQAVVTTLTQALDDGAVPASPEALLRLARAQLDAADYDGATRTLDRLGDERDWRAWWLRGLHDLAVGRPDAAVGWLDPVYTDLPGEVAAKLGLALAHELAGDLGRAAELYDAASRTDPSYVSGAFGLARVRLAAGDREGAVEALARVPAASSMHVTARIAAVRALAAQAGGTLPPPTAGQMARASAIIDQLYLDPQRRAELSGELFEAGLAALDAGADPTGAHVLGRPLTETSLREGLEATYRDRARLATTTPDRIALIDRANRVRPRTLL